MTEDKTDGENISQQNAHAPVEVPLLDATVKTFAPAEPDPRFDGEKISQQMAAEMTGDAPETPNPNPHPAPSASWAERSEFRGSGPAETSDPAAPATRDGQQLPTFGNPDPYIRERKKTAKAKTTKAKTAKAKTAKAKRHACKHAGCKSSFATAHGAAVHTYRMHSPKGKAWAKKTAQANRDTAVKKKHTVVKDKKTTKTSEPKVWGKKKAKIKGTFELPGKDYAHAPAQLAPTPVVCFCPSCGTNLEAIRVALAYSQGSTA